MELQENIQVELEQEYTTNIKKTVVAFANTDGGEVYIGITNSGKVIGLKDTDEVMLQTLEQQEKIISAGNGKSRKYMLKRRRES